MAVMLCLAEMVSVRPDPGAIFEYPKLFVDPALGYAVGFIYWMAYAMSLPTLIVTAAVITRYWGDSFPLGWTIFLLLLGVLGSNVFGVRLYGNLEWGFKWMKILLIVGLDILMIAINRGVGPTGRVIGGENFHKDKQFPPGFSSTHLTSTTDSPEIPGSLGVFLSVWSSITLAGYAFIGVELVVVTAGEARYPRRDLAKASRRIYLLTLILYFISAVLIACNVPFTNPSLLPLQDPLAHDVTGKRSPYIISISEAGIPFLPGFINAAFLFAAWTAANTALYVSSRTLFALAKTSNHAFIRRTIGKTSSQGTPLVAISFSFLFAFLSFLGVGKGDILKPLRIFARIATISILCVYTASCIAFLRFKAGMQYSRTIRRSESAYKERFYRSPRQPFPAIFGIVSCSLLIIFNGWDTFYHISKGTITRGEAGVQIVAAYLGPVLFLGFYVVYKVVYNTKVVGWHQFSNVYDPIERGLDDAPEESANWFRRVWSWII